MKAGPKRQPRRRKLPRLTARAPGQRVLEFFETHLRHTAGAKAGQPLRLAPWQRHEIITPLFGTLRADGLRQYRTAFVTLPRRNGKRLALDTPLPTPTGWIKLADVVVGTVLFDEQGQPCRVTGVWPIADETTAYRITFSDHVSLVADAEHLWFTKAKQHGGGKSHSRWLNLYEGVRTTEEIRQTLGVGKPRGRGRQESNHAVPVATALVCPTLDLPFPPYVLGAWLGDGTKTSAGFTCADPEIIEEIRREGIPVRSLGRRGISYWFGDGSRAQAARDGSPQAILRELGVLNQKHIPEAYLRASIEQRMALLQGLMDTDGTIGKKGQPVFTNTNPDLIEGVAELVRSLGFKAYVRTKMARLYRRIVGKAYDVEFWAGSDRPVFRLPRKRNRQKAQLHPTRPHWRHIAAIKPVPSVPMRCIAVDSPSHLYLAGEGMIPTHNSVLAAGVALYLVFADQEPGALVVSAAANREQARVVFDQAARMVEASPVLSGLAQVYRSEIVVPATGSRYKVLSRDSTVQHGMDLHGAVIDELHAHRDAELYRVLTSSTGSRRQPLTFVITTASADPHSIATEVYQYACRVREGAIRDPSLLTVIYAAPDDADPWDEAVWRACNPALRSGFRSLVELRTAALQAQAVPAREASFRQLYLNQWGSLGRANRWLPPEAWAACAGPVAWSALPESCAGRRAWLGLDLSTTLDLTAAVLVCPHEAGPMVVLPHFWVPEDRLAQRVQRDHVPYDLWARAGALTLTPGNVVDYGHIRGWVQAQIRRYAIQEIAFDPWNATGLISQLQDDGATCVEVRQGFASLSAATKELEKLVLGGQLRHGGHPVLQWCAANVVVQQDPAGNVKPDKAKSTERIDGIVALVTAMARWLAAPHTTPQVAVW